MGQLIVLFGRQHVSLLCSICSKVDVEGMTQATAPQSLGNQSMMVTVPALPSTRNRWPVLTVLVPNAVPVTAGSPYSRQTMAAWLMIPPTSVTVAAIFPNTGAQLGAVSGATSTSPSCRSP